MRTHTNFTTLKPNTEFYLINISASLFYDFIYGFLVFPGDFINSLFT